MRAKDNEKKLHNSDKAPGPYLPVLHLLPLALPDLPQLILAHALVAAGLCTTQAVAIPQALAQQCPLQLVQDLLSISCLLLQSRMMSPLGGFRCLEIRGRSRGMQLCEATPSCGWAEGCEDALGPTMAKLKSLVAMATDLLRSASIFWSLTARWSIVILLSSYCWSVVR